MLLRRGDAQAARWPCTCANLHIMVYLSEVCSHSRQCSCTTQRSSPRRRSAGTRPRRLLSSTVRRAPQPAAPRTPCTPADEPRLRAVVFCGIGGAAAGARSAGLDVALGVDIHAQRLGVFKLNFPEAESVCGQLAVPNSVFTEVRGRERACPVFERENFHRIRYRFVDETPLHTLTDLTRDPTSHESTSSLGKGSSPRAARRAPARGTCVFTLSSCPAVTAAVDTAA